MNTCSNGRLHIRLTTQVTSRSKQIRELIDFGNRRLKSLWDVMDYFYDNSEIKSFVLADYVQACLEDKYGIVHRNLLVWAPIPSPANVPRFRLLFVFF